MNYVETELFNNCCSEWQFYYNKILGDAGISLNKKALFDYLLTPTYYIDNNIYFDYRDSIINTLINSNINDFKTNCAYVLKMKEDEDTYQFVDNVIKNEYSIYNIIFFIAKLKNWTIEGNLLLDLKAMNYDTSLIIFNKYEILKQLDIYLNTNISDQMYALYQRTYKRK